MTQIEKWNLEHSGEKFNELTIIEDTGKRNSSRQRIVKCQCSCGKIIETDYSHIKNGHVKSCGHIRRKEKKPKEPKRSVQIGEKYGKLTVIDNNLIDKNGYHTKSLCKCECGNIIEVSNTNLKRNHTKSCGCLRREMAKNNFKNLIGLKFGRLKVLDKTEDRDKYGRIIWKCLCECGGIKYANTTDLINGKIKSCGCLKSNGELQIEKILTKYNVNFKREYIFKDLYDKEPLRFDFAIFDKKNNLIKLIEINGEQHYNKTNSWYSESLCKHDTMKKEYCNKNNIDLLIIPYSTGHIFTTEELDEIMKGII